ncbi:sodium-dependent lysophosphatidylcholine symporter 1-A isoform X3 [Magallana gigas]|uniref:sodium-dependent lysophosphatidylcholine symporter 1-A isoform X3 n=1 Tax=Magallana gigas TaxID=29159 RepID=UPI003341B4AE
MQRHNNKIPEDMESATTREFWEKSQPLPVWRKICFAIGGAPYQITSTVLGFFMSIFLLEVAQVDPSHVSVIVFGGKLWYAMTDPVCGYLVNRTKPSSWGKYKPWILLTMPFACVTYLCFWAVPDYSQQGKLWWYLVFYCLFQGFLSGVHVPYTSMTMSLSENQRDRDSITVYRMVAEAIGVMTGVIIQGHFIKKHRTAGSCEKGSSSSNQSSPSGDNIINQIGSYHDASVTIICIYVICILICFYGTKEQKVNHMAPEDGFFLGLQKVLFFRPYVKLSMSVLFLSVAISITQGNLALFCTHTLGMGRHFSTFITIIMVTNSSVYFYMHQPFAVFRSGILCKRGSARRKLLQLACWSMLPDVIDEFYITHGEHRDAIFYSFYVFFNKLATGFAVASSQFALKFGGYRVGVCQQPPSVGRALRYLMIPGPVVAVVIALVFLAQYPINDTKARLNAQKIKEKQSTTF